MEEKQFIVKPPVSEILLNINTCNYTPAVSELSIIVLIRLSKHRE